MAIIAPGMFLSQPPTASSASSDCPRHTVSMLSAMTSRDTRLHFIPSVPMLMPSLTVMVPNICGMPPAARIAASAASERSPSPALQGVMVLCPLATPTIGFAKSSSSKPTARSMARLGARWSPWVTTCERRFGAREGGLGVSVGASAMRDPPGRAWAARGPRRSAGGSTDTEVRALYSPGYAPAPRGEARSGRGVCGLWVGAWRERRVAASASSAERCGGRLAANGWLASQASTASTAGLVEGGGPTRRPPWRACRAGRRSAR